MSASGDFLKTYGDQAKRFGAIAAALVLVGGAGKWVVDTLDTLDDAIEDVESLDGQLKTLRGRVTSLEKDLPSSERAQEKALRTAIEATRMRFLEDERAAAELRGTVVALITEVRVRHGQPGYLPPIMAPRRPGGGSSDRLRVQVRQNKLASEALDQSLGRTFKAIPQKAPFVSLNL